MTEEGKREIETKKEMKTKEGKREIETRKKEKQ